MGDVFVLAQIQKDLQMLLAPIFDTYQEYACSDGKNFAGNIGCVRINKDNTMEAVALEDWDKDRKTAKNKVFSKIDQKTDVDKQLEASAFGATLGAAQGYTLEKIKIAADNIDLAKSAVCTTFAVSGANKLLELQKSPEYKDKIKRVEIIARKYGHRGTHCYVVINRKEGSDLNDPNTWGSDALVVDPWLSSLQNPSVYKPEEYALSGFLTGKLQCNFDSTNPNLRKEKKLKIALKQEMKEAYISHIKEGNLDKIQDAMILYGHKVETVKLGKGFENLFTQAIKYKQTELFKNLWKKIENPAFIENRGPQILNHAIASNNFELVKFLHENGVDLCNHMTHPYAIERAMEIALNTGDDAMFAYILREEVAQDPNCEFILSTLVKLPLLHTRQGLNINSYLCLLPDATVAELSSWSANMQTILEYAGTQLEAWEAEAQVKYPNAFKSDTGSEPSSAPSSSPSSPALSPRASAHGLPPPPPAMPSPDYFKPLPKSEKEVELSKYRREKAYRIEELKRHLKENCDMDLSNEMIAHLGDHIDQWEALRAHFDEFSTTRVAYRKALEGVDDKESLVSSAMMLHEYKERLEALSESIQGAQDEINKILSQSDRESNVNSVKIERIKLLLSAYEKKLERISKSLDNDFTENDKAALNLTDIVEQRDNIRRDIGALSSLITIISTKEQPSLNLAAQSNDFDLVKTLALKTTNLGARDNDGKTFLNYLNPSQVQELSAFLLENGAAKNALKVALLQQDINLVKKISTEFKINLFDINSNDDPIWNYLPSTLSDESTFSKMSYFFSTHETFNHWLNQTLKDKMNSLHAQFHPTFAKLDVELMEINETLIGIREPSMPIERYIEQANEKCKEIQATLEAFEAEHASLLHPNYEHLNEVSGKYKALKEVLSNLHQSLTDVQTNSQDRLKEEAESKKRPKSN